MDKIPANLMFYSQMIVIILVVIAAIVNISVLKRDNEVWVMLLSSAVGILLPTPKYRKEQ